MGAWLLLQVAYFASMLFLIWRSSRAQSGRQRAKRSIIARKDAISRKRIMRATNECSDALQPGQTLRVSALPWVAFHYYLSAQDKTPLPCLRLPRGTPG
nr:MULTISPECIES: exopolysaccharide production repressor protein [Rhizobium]